MTFLRMLFLLLLFSITYPVSAETLQLVYQHWSGPRSGERILSIPVIRQTMQQLSADENLGLLIRYPGGEDGIIWVSELKAWLVAFGLDSARIETRPGSPSADIIELEIVVRKGTY